MESRRKLRSADEVEAADSDIGSESEAFIGLDLYLGWQSSDTVHLVRPLCDFGTGATFAAIFCRSFSGVVPAMSFWVGAKLNRNSIPLLAKPQWFTGLL
jgi:hypothetical protein